ncbi:hypothetical protein QOZ80_4BG0357300 [Eleusine coracana subsp. coracana]|nr:hypothetical protein QOZ80_4BG0357300 [Eleusine coracana subsp. coracana]
MELAAKIGMDSERIKYWFQNRRWQMKVKSCSKERDQVRVQNNALKTENTELWNRVLEKRCFPCICLMSPREQLTEKQRLLIENMRLKKEIMRTKANHKELHLAVPSIIAHHRVTLILQHAERAMKEFQALAEAGMPMWLPSDDGEVLNFGEYTPAVFPRLLAPCPEGFVTEATRETAIVWATARDLVTMLTDADRWSEMFLGIVGVATAREIGSSTMLSSRDGMIQLMNAELCVQSPRVLNRSVKFLRFTKMAANGRQWAVVDVSIDGILADGLEGQAELLPEPSRCLLLPSGCLLEDMDGGCCKVTWIVHAEYDKTVVPELFRPLLRSGQALGAHRWLSTLMRQCEFMGVLKNFRSDDGSKAIMEVARRMTASFYPIISGPINLLGTNVSEWRGSAGTGTETFEAVMRMAVWNCPTNVPGQQASYMEVLSAITTVWLPNTEPQVVLDYLRDEKRRGEWDILADGAQVVNDLGTIITGNHHGNSISVLRPYVADDTNNHMLILQEVCSDNTFSLVVYSVIEWKAMLAITEGADPSSNVLLPSGFAILPDGHKHTTRAPSAATSSSNAHNITTGCILTGAYQILWPNPPTENLAADTFDNIGKQLCRAIEKIKAAVRADIIVPA